MISSLKRLMFGRPLKSDQIAHQRLSNAKALAVLSSDALSSTAYGGEEVLLILMLAGQAAISLFLPISFAICALVLIVVISYRQVVNAYPTGGGSYIVAKENLSVSAGLTAGAALSLDYVLTVAVSACSGVAAITSAFPKSEPWTVHMCLAVIALVTIINLRGIKESGAVFSIPTYGFVFGMLLLITIGFFQWLVLGHPPRAAVQQELPALQGLTLFLVLRAFSSGCATLTGIEAVSNGIKTFHEPVSKNAAITLSWMAGLLISMTAGLAILCVKAGIHPIHDDTMCSQLARSIFHDSIFYYYIQVVTALILFMAVNTSYADFPRLWSVMARDGFVPRQFANLGDRLVFTNGIVVLSILAAILIVHYKASTHALIPLYAVGVFLSFTLSQAGMVMHWVRLRKSEPRWLTRSIVNGIGAFVTLIVTCVIATTKFVQGAWMIVLLIPIMVLIFRAVKTHYMGVEEELAIPLDEKINPVSHTIIIPVAGITRTLAQTLAYARTLTADVRTVHISSDPQTTEKLRDQWKKWDPGFNLIMIDSPYRSLMGPLLKYINNVERKTQNDVVTIMLPEFIPRLWWHHLLHNQNALILKTVLLFRPNTVVVNVPYHLKH